MVATTVADENSEEYEYLSSNSPSLSYPVSDSEISVTRGVFNNTGSLDSSAWGAFTNITTTAAVPEPGSIVLLGMGVGSLVVYARTRRRRLLA